MNTKEKLDTQAKEKRIKYISFVFAPLIMRVLMLKIKKRVEIKIIFHPEFLQYRARHKSGYHLPLSA